MPTFSPQSYAAELERLAAEVDTIARAKLTMAQAVRAQAIAERVASGDLGGDPKFSGWAPTLDTKLKPTRDGATILSPTRTSAGPWTVAQQGRNRGNASGFQGPGIGIRSGLTARTKSGALRKVQARRAKRWNGYTDGKGTADKFRAALDREMPPIAEAASRQVIAKHFDVT